VSAGNGNDTVTAQVNSTITLGTGHDTVYAGANDITTLGNGNGNDTVAFGLNPSPAAFGSETVNNFNAHLDQIDLSIAQFVSYAAMISAGEIYQSGSNTIINDHSGNTATLAGVKLASLSASNFHFS
jgi:Ca2+-binding RTX toxin-like protein